MSKVTAKYQVTIPKKVRKELGIVPGSEVDITKRGQEYVLIIDPIGAIKNKWCGKLKDGTTTDEYMNKVRGEIF